MAFCKVCACGNKIVFERILSFPDSCPSCGRRLVDFLTYNEDDPQVEEKLKRKSTSDGEVVEETQKENSGKVFKKYVIKLSNGKEIEIPEQGCIVGRTEVGAEELAEFPSVSRQHIRIVPRRNIGVLIEDISSYGTFVDGLKIVKNTPVRVAEGSMIQLCDLETVLIVKEEEG